MNKKLDAYWDFLIEYGIVSEDALRLITNINGYSEDTLNDVLYCQTGNRSVEQYCDENDIELPEFVNESINNISSITNKILEGADITQIIGIQTEASTILRDKEITGTDDVDELVLYIVNDGNIYRSRTSNIIDNLKKKYKAGKYDRDLAVKAFMYVVDDGVRKYDKEFVSGQGKLFLDKATREEIAKQLRDHYEEQVTEEYNT